MDGSVATLAPALAQAARTVGSPQIRNAGTIGGNLGTASPAGDTLPVLVALGASVEVASAAATRTLPIGDFLTGPKATALAPGELIVSVRLPVARGPQEYLKVGVRNAMVIAVASVAMVVDREAGTVGVGLGSVGPTALAAPDACTWLTAHDDWTDPAVADEFAIQVATAARPIDDHRGRASYRRHAVGVMARRALRRCAR
jgi:CO/xanthine dehydrogenase FAD-binding subunit